MGGAEPLSSGVDELFGGLPEGWSARTIAELIGDDGLLTDGDWVETKDQDPAGEVRLVQLADIGVGFFKDRSRRFLTLERAKALGCTFLQPGDVLVARMPDPIGRACIFPGSSRPCVTAVDVCIVRPSPDRADNRWLCNAINSPQLQETIEGMGKGTTRLRVSRSALASLTLPVPPVPEQRRIVAKVEARLARVNAARDRLARVPAILKRFRQSVLAAACSGHLTEDWRMNRKGSLADPASPDFPIVEQGTPQPEDLPGEWRWVPFECLLETLRMGTTIPPQLAQTAFPVLRSSSVRTMGIDYADVKFLPECPPEHDTVMDDDLLITRLSGSLNYVANCARVGDLGDQLIAYPDRLFRARLKNRAWSPYLELCFANPDLRSLLAIESKSSAGHQRVSMSGIRAFPIPFAPLQEQQEIVRRVGALFALADTIEQRAATSLRRADRLTQSILSKAFGGELVSSQAAE